MLSFQDLLQYSEEVPLQNPEWVIFKNESLVDIVLNLKGMFGVLDIPFTSPESLYYLKSNAVLLIAAAVGATPVAKNLYVRLKETRFSRFTATAAPVVFAALLVISTGYIVDSSFNPFLYFRF